MANQEHLDILAKGLDAWDAWRNEVDVTPDLTGANLVGATLVFADLSGADLTRADLSRANFTYALLNSANLTLACLSGANLTSADLSDVDLSNADMSHVDLVLADLNHARFDRALFGYTVVGNVDLSTVKGLETVLHVAPSTIGIDTIHRSKGKIPESFLRGAGIPSNFITLIKSLPGGAFDFYSCFISYSTTDREFVDRLYTDLQANGVRCWCAPHDIRRRNIHDQIGEAIHTYDKLVLILSDASMNSNWVKTEIADARGREAQRKSQVLFPITTVPYDRIKDWKLLDTDCGIDSASEVREYFIPDFSNWRDHDSYEKAFERLLSI